MPSVTIGGKDYPAFISVDDADSYLAADSQRAAKWALLQPDAKGRAIVSATRYLLGRITTWCPPVPDPTSDTIPEPLADVTAMLAADGAAKPALFADASGNSNVKVAKAGSAQVEFFTPGQIAKPPLPIAMWSTLLAAKLVGCSSVGGVTDGGFVSGSDYRRDPYRDCGWLEWADRRELY